MRNQVLLLGIAILGLLSSCTKDEVTTPEYAIKYKLSGWYLRDTAIKTDGLKGIHFNDGNYCWNRQIAGKDSFRCDGTYIQTSDSTFLWNGSFPVNFKVTLLDEASKTISLQVVTSPPSSALIGTYR
ncbi:MAG: hypothetical protein ACOVP1_03905 [Bacteroidia bacterium]